MEPLTYSGFAEVVDRLAQLGIRPDQLRDAVAIGESFRSACTPNDPAITGGFLAWAKTTRALRELLAQDGWRRRSTNGLETVVHAGGLLEIAVATGGGQTGHVGGTPRTKYARGPATVAAVERNQMSLFETSDPIVPGMAPARTTPMPTWLLLVAPGVHHVHCELALPNDIDNDGNITSWVERIILDPVARDPEPIVETPTVDGEPDVVVEVSRRRS